MELFGKPLMSNLHKLLNEMLMFLNFRVAFGKSLLNYFIYLFQLNINDLAVVDHFAYFCNDIFMFDSLLIISTRLLGYGLSLRGALT